MSEEQRDRSDKQILLAAFETARAWSSLIVTLSTGSIVFTAIFRDKFAAAGQPIEGAGILLAAWILLAAAAMFGVFFLGNLAYILNEGKTESLDVYGSTTRFVAFLQVATFFAGIVVLLIFFVKNLPL